jgi:CRP/FNR family transcriptional regulator, cyclic AMP receptor protein
MFMRAAREASAASSDVLVLPQWTEANWVALLGRTELRRVNASEIVIARGSQERALYFTAIGDYEVGGAYMGGASLTWLARIPAGSVFGEQSFFDGLPRSANVWAHAQGELLVLPFESYQRFAEDTPDLARDFIFALARILSLRLRNTTVRVH